MTADRGGEGPDPWSHAGRAVGGGAVVNVMAGGPDYLTYNPETDRIDLLDATAGKLPQQLYVPEYWMPEARAAVE